jgi:hypothetical protein
VGLLNRKLMSDKQAAKVADAQAMYEAAIAANPGALPEMRELSPQEAQASAAAAMAERQTLQRLHDRGIDAPAVLHSLRPTGQRDLGGGMEFEFDLTVEPPAGGSHRTTIRQHMLPVQVQGLAEGGPLTVRYDPEEPDNAILTGW